MLTALHTKLLIAIVALLASITSYMAYQHDVLLEQQRIEAARRRHQEEFQKQLQKNNKEDNTWTDGAQAMHGFKLP